MFGDRSPLSINLLSPSRTARPKMDSGLLFSINGEKRMQGIYRIHNLINGKYYIGSTNDFEKGWISRRLELRRGAYHNAHLQHAWNKYGEENFVFEIEEEVKGNNKALLTCEQGYLDEGFELGILYNVARKAGGGNLGEEVNQKISEGLIGRVVTWGNKISKANTGHKASEDTRAKMSKALTGHEVSEETRNKISKANTGRKVSEELRARLSEANKGQVPWNKGIPRSKECKAKISKANLGKKRSKEFKANLSKINSGKNGPNYGGGEATAKPYPAFYNGKTGEHISAGKNLKKLCQGRGLSYGAMSAIKRRINKQTKDGWRLA